MMSIRAITPTASLRSTPHAAVARPWAGQASPARIAFLRERNALPDCKRSLKTWRARPRPQRGAWPHCEPPTSEWGSCDALRFRGALSPHRWRRSVSVLTESAPDTWQHIPAFRPGTCPHPEDRRFLQWNEDQSGRLRLRFVYQGLPAGRSPGLLGKSVAGLKKRRRI